MSERVAYGYVIHFRDGGEPEEQVLGIGTPEDAERAHSLMPGVAYSGARPVDHAEWVTVPAPPPVESEGTATAPSTGEES